MSLPKPPPGSRVCLVFRDGRKVCGDVLDARLQSGRWPVKAWGLEEKTLCIDPAEVAEVEIVDLPTEQVREIAHRQRVELDPTSMAARRARMLLAKDEQKR
jgi:hypothetical protein